MLSYKRLARGRFRMPSITAGADRVVLDGTELAMLLGGFDVARAQRARRGSRRVAGPRRSRRIAPRRTKQFRSLARGDRHADARHDQSWSLVPPGDDDHDCGWKAYAKAQESKLASRARSSPS